MSNLTYIVPVCKKHRFIKVTESISGILRDVKVYEYCGDCGHPKEANT